MNDICMQFTKQHFAAAATAIALACFSSDHKPDWYAEYVGTALKSGLWLPANPY
jgi:hypothetical protein